MFKKRILTICPTRERPEICERMFDSFLTTSTESDIMFALDNDDPMLPQFGWLFKYRANFIVYHRMNITQILNRISLQENDYDFYHITNDDFFYQTQGWDRIFIDKLESKGGGIAYGNDLYLGPNMCTAPFISGDIVRALGWIQMPTLTHLYGDMAWRHIGFKLNRLYYCGEVIIEHRHVFNKKAEEDNVYRETNSREMYLRDDAAFREWIRSQSGEDIKKISEALNK